MKKIITMLMVGCFLGSYGVGVSIPETGESSPATAAGERADIGLARTVVFSAPVATQSHGVTTIRLAEATSYSMEEGKPELPVVTEVFTFPFGTRIGEVHVALSGARTWGLPAPVAAAKTPHLRSTVFAETYREETQATDYTDIDLYPPQSYRIDTASGLSGNRRLTFLVVNIYPVTYTPAENTISYARQADIAVTYRLPEAPVQRGDTYDLLVLAPATYAADLQPLIDYKNANGVASTMTEIEDIPSAGADQQEDIKYYIKEAIETWGITYVLLVGGGLAGNEQFPVRYAWIGSGSYEENFPSDLYYADIYDAAGNFSTWDANGNGRYAEYPADMPAVDVVPDVYLGRLPCTSRFEVKTMVNKIIDFSEHNSMTNTIAQIGGDTFPGDRENVNEGEFANTNVLQNLPGYESIRLWASEETLTKNGIIRAVNSGVDFVDFSGHGSVLSYATHPPGDDEHWIPETTFYSPYSGFLYLDANWLFNVKKYPVIMYNACSCSKFSESPYCMSWQSIRRPWGGGIASFGASGIGYGNYGRNETSRLFGWMEVHLFANLYQNKILGQAWGDAIALYARSFDLDDGDYKTLLELALFGDPSLAIDDGVDPTGTPASAPLRAFLSMTAQTLAQKYPLLEALFGGR
jgi:hypothetical protein